MMAQRMQHQKAAPRLARAGEARDGASVGALLRLACACFEHPPIKSPDRTPIQSSASSDDALAMLKGGGGGDGDGEDPEPVSDDEWKDIATRAAASHVVKKAPAPDLPCSVA